jgi:hypothetical protein
MPAQADNNIDDIGTITIPTLGECTLFSLAGIVGSDRRYQKAVLTVQKLGLQVLEPLTHEERQVVFLSLAEIYRDDICILLSGEHESFAQIATTLSKQEKKLCVTAMVLFYMDDGYVTMDLTEIPTDKILDVSDDPIMCLFKGKLSNA